jgi:hypothetical protein
MPIIPLGKSRIIEVDLFAFEEYFVKDCDTRAEAFELLSATAI